jgi:hypothetical protein
MNTPVPSIRLPLLRTAAVRWITLAIGLLAGLGSPSNVSAIDWFASGEPGADYNTINVGSMILHRAARRDPSKVDGKGMLIRLNGQDVTGYTGQSRYWDANLARPGRVRFTRPASFPARPLNGFTASFDTTFRYQNKPNSSSFGSSSYLGSGDIAFKLGDMTASDVLIASGYGTQWADYLGGGLWYRNYGGGLSVAVLLSGTQGEVRAYWKGQFLGSSISGSETREVWPEQPGAGAEFRCTVKVLPSTSNPGKHTLTVEAQRLGSAGQINTVGTTKKLLQTDLVFDPDPAWEFGFTGNDGWVGFYNEQVGQSGSFSYYDNRQNRGGVDFYLRRIRIDAAPMVEVGQFANASGVEGKKYEVTLPISDTTGQVSVSAAADNPNLIGPITVAGGKLSFTPPIIGGSTATSTITVRFAGGLVTRTFRYTVETLDDPPTLDTIADQKLRMNVVDPLEVNLTGIGAGPGDQQELRLYASSSDRSVLPDPVVEYATPNTTAKLRLKPLAGQSGDVRVTVTVRDAGGNSVQQTFKVSIASPTLIPPANQTYDEDSGPHTLTITGIGDSRYEVVPGAFTWVEAKADAIRRGGYLATITSEEEWDAIKSASVPDADRYVIVPGSYSWDEALADAPRRGGRLVVIDSEAKWTQIRNLIGDSLVKAGFLWIGAHEPNKDGKYSYITGKPLTYSRWSPGEPNRSGDGIVLGFPWGDPDLRWDDQPKGNRNGYLMERLDMLSLLNQQGTLWFGLYDYGTTGTWKWVTGEAFSYSRWADGEPNRSGDAGIMGFPADGNLRWDDTPGYPARRPYFMEYGRYVEGVPGLYLRATSSLPDLVEPVLTYNGRGSTAQLVLNLKPNANSLVFGNQPATITLTLSNLVGAVRRETFTVTVNALVDTPLAGGSRGIDFQGQGQAVAGDPGLSGQSFTLESWARRNTLNRLDPIVSLGTNGLFLGFLSDNKVKFGFAGAAGAGLVSTVPYTDTAWHHWAATYDAVSGRRQLFRDGTLLVQDTVNTPYTAVGSLRLGGMVGDVHFNGALQEVRLWRGVRSAVELGRWRDSAVASGTQDGLIGYWRANEGVWPTLENLGSSGPSLTASIVGSVSRIGDLANLVRVSIPEKAVAYPIALPAFHADTSGESGLTFEILRRPAKGTLGVSDGGKVTFTPNPGVGGDDFLTYRVLNGDPASETVQVNLRIEVVNDPPEVSRIASQTLFENDDSLVIPITIADEETVASQLVVTATSSDTTVLPNSGLSLSGEGTSRILTIQPQAGVYAVTTILVEVSDGVNTTQRSFQLQLSPSLAYKVIALPGPVGTQVTQPSVIANDGRVGGYGETLNGDSTRPFINLGFLNNFSLQTSGIDQLVGRINGMATANGLKISVGDAIVGGERQSFVHNGNTATPLGKPDGSTGSYALAVNSRLTIVGYATYAQGSSTVERAYRGTGNAGSFTLLGSISAPLNFPATTSSRAVAINSRGDILVRSGEAGDYATWLLPDGGTAMNIGVPNGYKSPNPLSITDAGDVLVEVEALNDSARRLAFYTAASGASAAQWSVLADAKTAWPWFRGGRANDFGVVVGSARTTPLGADTAVLNSGGVWFRMDDLIPADSGWVLETATSINADGMIVGRGRYKGAPTAYIAVPASVIGKRVARPSGTVARYPMVQILEGGLDDNEQNSFFWSELEKSLYAIRPVTARIRWFTTSDMMDVTSPMIASFAANIWPKTPYIHVAGVPMDVEPAVSGSMYRFAQMAYSTDREAKVDSGTKQFNSLSATGSTYTVLHYLKTFGRAPDPLFQTNAFMVLRTLSLSQAPLASTESVTVGSTLSNTNHTDYPGKNGYLFFTNSVVDVYGERAAYQRSDRRGPLNIVNSLGNAANGQVGVQAPVVVWFEMTPFGVAVPNRPVTYQTSWPNDTRRIVIASGRGSNHDGLDPITADRYGQPHLYVQSDPRMPGFNPNEEHALIAPSSFGQAVYALRNDLNPVRGFSEAFCLLKYKDQSTGEWRIRPYSIVTEESPWFLRFAGDAGKEIQPPMPLSLLPLMPASYVSAGDAFRDYNNKLYARGAGAAGRTSEFVLRWFYPLQPDFFYDLNGDGVVDVPVGWPVAWLDRRAQTVNGEPASVGKPVPTVYTIGWPDAPALEVGQTLTTPVNGLPDVRNMAKVQVIYDSLDTARIGGAGGMVRLFDPISERSVPFSSALEFTRTATDNRGRKIFLDLPFSLRVRLSYDPVNGRLCFRGYEDRTGIGEPLLLPNIMSAPERQTIVDLVDSSNAIKKQVWSEFVGKLYRVCLNPNGLDLNGDGTPDEAMLSGLRRLDNKIVPEEFGDGPKALTAADPSVAPALPDPGKAVAFSASGTSQHLKIENPRGSADADGKVPRLRGTFSIEFWMRPRFGTTETSTLVRLGANPLKALRVGYRSGHMTFEFNTQRLRSEELVATADRDVWQHYAFVYDSEAQRATIFRNGLVAGSADGFSLPLDPADRSPLYFGGDPSSSSQRFVGHLDEIRLWDGVALDASRILASANKKTRIGQTGLVGYWRFDTATGASAPDESGLGLEGTFGVPPVFEVQSAALAPYGIPPRFVTLVENNDAALGGLPVSLKIIEINGGPYLGDLKVLPNDNPFDSRLILRHSSDFAGRPEQAEFEWWYHPYEPLSRTNLPSVSALDGTVTDTRGWIRHSAGKGLNQITLGGSGESGLLVISDNWFIMRYRGFNVNGNTNWSPWIGDPSSKSVPAAMLAEGWVKRVMRGLNPFDARATDFDSAKASTVVSMLQQAGARYEGDIAFNPDPDYINSIGLIEAYQTVLNRAAGLSIEGVPAVNYGPANDALLLAAGRIADLYTLLGNEAVADAADPTIGFTTTSSEYGSAASSIFAFQNQLDSPLDEELSLLRGRDDSSAGVQGAPVYNRLLWNFTMGDGEVAYSQVYNMSDQNRDGRIDEKDAKILYPQGHGDAWGHYLTAIKGYYDLLRHPNFTWQPRSEAVLLAGVPIKVDYLDERKFVTTAANKARAGIEIVDLTYRQKYVADASGQWQGYSDTDPDRAWGVGEWAQRAATGTYLDWVVGNAILPAVDPDPNHTGLDKIDRQTVDELVEITDLATDFVEKIDQADRGFNPLGLAAGVVPFDLDPAEVDAGKTHFEQVANRARTALLNARTLFDEANSMTVALRRSADSQEDLTRQNANQERELENRLIEIYGYPYEGDIGAGKTYPSGYSGPDLIHYMYVETADVNNQRLQPDQRLLSYQQTLNKQWAESAAQFPKANAFDFSFGDHMLGIISLEMVKQRSRTIDSAVQISKTGPPSIDPITVSPVEYPTSSEGYSFSAPSSWGRRRAQGEIQNAIMNLVQQQARFKQAQKNYEILFAKIDEKVNGIRGEKNIADTELRVFDQKLLQGTAYRVIGEGAKATAKGMEMASVKLMEYAYTMADSLPKSVGTANDVFAANRGIIKTIASGAAWGLAGLATATQFYGDTVIPMQREAADQLSDRMLILDKKDAVLQEKLKEGNQLIREEPVQRLELFNQREALDQATEAVRAAIAKGQRVAAERSRLRTEMAGDATKLRYKDMAFRMFRNEALGKYRAQFDLAARYVYLAATAYDYDVNMIGKGNSSGVRFLTDIVKHRSLGQLRVDDTGVAPVAGRMGLADPLARMEQNFSVQKTQMGFNNPQTETGRFSLRNELFRLRGASDEDWRKTLRSKLVDDVWDLPEFRRYCRPFAPETAGPQPGLVIRFPTTVTFGLNFFGWPLGGGDSAYDPSNFATKIRSAGIWFSGYNGNGMSVTPRVYLVPVGADVLRAQDGNDFETRMWRVIDQKIPVPFPIGSAEMKNSAYRPAFDSLGGSMAEIRKYSSFRAYHDSGAFSEREAVTDSRLIGRSVWNSEWMLVIPGGTLLNDPRLGLETFINSVGDIKLFFQTYAYSGN